ncbi:NAD(P)-dependent dehydrogenase, short-chain alcohol dehydrogenase family [Nitrosomonas cryotolerans]|uniref:NAD(P)-dependent dehydrogenase, short-chain alcohol dehydrogenase family n=1 Tax=Nitrosomonas cryotolerans ATCC 49181 TaxID=1131553 RepID=A0A1N6IEZ2_9PROT|nr:SDR family oxidoreductase [Nitrosomonas cryotolerans]SFP80870.1 NAD(P)-dependent dehydrogenase, short-chain alcohol dehydrogenase family [Nitrosomonas cryotolerans]SIO30606.1 NAD(P)-dependent dehydrogenase, short-chain alcohol dehydrogenase family [Nitrosomonas cryotolerans ATCC 49181]
MRTVLITGANRGIGLEFVRQYAVDGWRVLACSRHPAASDALNNLAVQYADLIAVYALDVEKPEQIENLSQMLSNEVIDLLINNAGIYPSERVNDFGRTDYEAWVRAFQVNTMAPLKIAESLIMQVARSNLKMIVTLTSKMGSIADNHRGGSYVYRSSKAAVNIVMKSMAIDLKPTGITAVLLHPGWVRTDMGGPNGLISVEQSVTGMRDVISHLTLADSGKFYAFDGQTIPW